MRGIGTGNDDVDGGEDGERNRHRRGARARPRARAWRRRGGAFVTRGGCQPLLICHPAARALSLFLIDSARQDKRRLDSGRRQRGGERRARGAPVGLLRLDANGLPVVERAGAVVEAQLLARLHRLGRDEPHPLAHLVLRLVHSQALELTVGAPCAEARVGPAVVV